MRLLTAETGASWLLCMGMPKCGTTTLAAMLAENPCFAVHHQKEPNDFSQDLPGGKPRLSGYSVVPETRFLVDFSTLYGMPWNRKRVLENLGAISEVGDARFILALRDPAALAESFFHHMLSRRGYRPERDAEILRRSIEGAVDFRSALSDLLGCVGAGQVFVTKLEDLSTAALQRQTVAAVSAWLDVPAVFPSERVQSNTRESARRYIPALESLILKVRRMDTVRQLPVGVRQLLGRAVSRPAETEPTEFVLQRWAEPALVREATEIYNCLRTGPLDVQEALVTTLVDGQKPKVVSRH